MKRKIIAAVFILIMVLFGFLLFRYIFLYNRGNREYERMNYTGAIEEYQSALNAFPPHKKECSIRINLALAMIYNLGPEFAEPENVEHSIEVLLAAKDVLLEDECATLEGDGHSETAEQLKREIDELLQQLQQEPPPEGSSEEEEEENGGSSGNIDEETEQNIMEELQQTQSTATQERQENIEMMEDWSDEPNLEFNISNW